ncbi:hypothetical protein MD484_g1027, partial [Candolleomyces efflorescens]
MNVRLDEDILRHICSLLSPEALRSASTVHRVFYDGWIKERYKEVNLTRGDKESKRLWGHVQENQSIANVVKCVHIKPWLVKPKTQTYQSKTENALNTLAMLFNPDFTKSQARKRFEKRLEKDINRVHTLIATLTNVREYQIEWDESPKYHNRLFLSFLQPALQSWHATLTHLSIHAPLDLLKTFVTVRLPQLTHIHICLSSGHLAQRQIDIHLEGFLVFLHNLKDTLTSISIQTTPSSENLELSRFFQYLGDFPHLRALSLMIPFDGAQLSSNPQMFTRFVLKHRATLESLSLKTTRCAVHSERVAPECINWIQTILSSIRTGLSGSGSDGIGLPELQHVTVALRPLKAPLQIVSNFLAYHSSSLKSITLMDRALDLTDVCAVLPAFSHSGLSQFVSMPLRCLEMRIDALSPHFLGLMARRLPGLQSLKLELVDRTQMTMYVRNPRRFVQDLDALGFDGANWELRRLVISPGAGRFWITALERILLPLIPGLEAIEELAP